MVSLELPISTGDCSLGTERNKSDPQYREVDRDCCSLRDEIWQGGICAGVQAGVQERRTPLEAVFAGKALGLSPQGSANIWSF